MKNLRHLFLVPIALLALSSSAFAHPQGGGNKACLTTYLPAGVWSLVAYDNAGQPCATGDTEGDPTCDPNALWDWPVQGHLVFTNAPGYSTTLVGVQLWAGNHGGSCHGGTTSPIVCDNPSTHWLQENVLYENNNPSTDLVVPFSFLFYMLQPFYQQPYISPSQPGDANYSGFWIFARPSGRPAICVSQNYWDLPDLF